MSKRSAKLILYMATSLNGYITRGPDDSDWVSEVDWREFDRLKRESKIMVMGSHTYQQFHDDFPQDGALNVVMTHNQKLLSQQIDGALFTEKTPVEVKDMAAEQGYSQIMLIGGMTLNTSFLKAGLIDEIWLDVHPLFIGEGKTLFEKIDISQHTQLFESKDLGSGQMLLKYRLHSS